MMIYVLIEREIAAEMQSSYEEAARRILTSAYRTVGFIEGQTYIERGNPLRRFTLSSGSPNCTGNTGTQARIGAPKWPS